MKSWLEVDAERLKANFRAVQAVAGPEYKVLAVIKANAYGHGAALCAPVLVDAGAHWLGVSDVEEGIAVRAALRDLVSEVRLLVMCGFEPGDAEPIVQNDLTPVVWTAEHLRELQRAATRLDARVRVHIEVDTGMARQGCLPGEELEDLVAVLQTCSRVKAEGLFSHLSSSEVAGSPQTVQQRKRMPTHVHGEPGVGLFPELLHLGNTSAVDAGVELAACMTCNTQGMRAAQGMRATPMVRTGLALYGYALPLEQSNAGAVPVSRLRPGIAPVGTWKTRITGLREIGAGDTVGYGATFVAAQPTRLALLPVGYADGFRREASSGMGDGWVVIAGHRARVVGRVSMNLTVVDVTELPNCAVGHEVVLLGEGVTADDHARWCGTIPYEILCGMRAHRLLV